MNLYSEYVVKEERSDGFVSYSRVGDAPDRIAVTLELLTKIDDRTMYVRHNSLYILNDHYHISAWDSDMGALICEKAF